MVFGQEMAACPQCGSFHIGYSTPIKLDQPLPETAEGMFKAWAKARKDGQTPLKGTCCIMCRDCGHTGPSVNVAGRTAEDVGKDPEVASLAKRLWNYQQRKEGEPTV